MNYRDEFGHLSRRQRVFWAVVIVALALILLNH